ncbi:MAG: glycoside hydrolase family 130 protein [Desulfobacterales bacterium]|nr:glycoside hydrolase family 130 protein [Desulfobacterales bacterium]
MAEEKVSNLLEQVMEEFSHRHRNFREALEDNFNKIIHLLPPECSVSTERKLLLGSYFTCEYSVEAAALFNPSIVLHPDQSGMGTDKIRFIMSFRATGEGHISSVEFRSGVINKNIDIYFDPISEYVETPEIVRDHAYNKHLFQLKLNEMEACNEVTTYILNKLADEFSLSELEAEIKCIDNEVSFPGSRKNETVEIIRWLARSNYEIKFGRDHRISERVIFPVSENESRGIEDARFVRFIDGEEVTYYATYTACNSFMILPQLIETKDFLTFKIITLNGKAVQNKGMALFPRRIKGNYVMLSRQDGENNYIMISDHLHFWQEYTLLQKPSFPWEFIQIGNCGSPLETEAGWLVLTHGVGPMRKYCIGIELLDLDDPSRVLSRLEEPVIVASHEEREGYVPNVVYTCGAMIHKDELIIPYGMADSRTCVASLPLSEIMERLRPL